LQNIKTDTFKLNLKSWNGLLLVLENSLKH